ncbi:MAG: hypothetical protein M0008_08895 [Actinomycetota bacterium]|nr:hypothetical protein [Actinomycetota bacterium]
MLSVSDETREQVLRIGREEFGGASADETVRRLVREHWQAAAIAAVHRYSESDPQGWADYLAEADKFERVRGREQGVSLQHLDNQLLAVRAASEAPHLPDDVWRCLATTIHEEITGLDDTLTNRLRLSVLVPPERYAEELAAFQAWMDIAQANANNPAIVRAQVMTELYVAFVWLRDSLMKPIAAVDDQTTFAAVEHFFSSGRRRTLRNAIAHGRWCYLPNFSGLECWAKPGCGQPHERFEISTADLEAWQLLSRGTAIAALLALTEAA